jgi:hypothetical protein
MKASNSYIDLFPSELLVILASSFVLGRVAAFLAS